MTKRISFDLDGVLCDFCKGAVPYIQETLRPDLPDDYVATELCFGEILSPEEWSSVFRYMLDTENVWLTLPSYEQAIQALRHYIEVHGDSDIYYVTSRPESAGSGVLVQTQLGCGN